MIKFLKLQLDLIVQTEELKDRLDVWVAALELQKVMNTYDIEEMSDNDKLGTILSYLNTIHVKNYNDNILLHKIKQDIQILQHKINKQLRDK